MKRKWHDSPNALGLAAVGWLIIAREFWEVAAGRHELPTSIAIPFVGYAVITAIEFASRMILVFIDRGAP